jgi:hypothetical protein
MLRMNYSLVLFVVYVDDLMIIVFSTSTISAVKNILHDRFLMTNMGPLHFYLGLDISQDASGIKLSQAKYAQDFHERFHMTDYKYDLTFILLQFTYYSLCRWKNLQCLLSVFEL